MTLRQRFILECNRMRRQGFDVPRGYVKAFNFDNVREDITRKELRAVIARDIVFYNHFKALPGWYVLELIDGTYKKSNSLGKKEVLSYGSKEEI